MIENRECRLKCRCPHCGHVIETEKVKVRDEWTPKQNVEALVGLAIVILGSAGLGGWAVAICLGGGS